MINPKLIEIWKRNGFSEEQIKEKLKSFGTPKEDIEESFEIYPEDESYDIKTFINTGKKTRNRKKRYNHTITFVVDDFLFERLQRCMFDKETGLKFNRSVFYRQIFEDSVKNHHKNLGFDWESNK